MQILEARCLWLIFIQHLIADCKCGEVDRIELDHPLSHRQEGYIPDYIKELQSIPTDITALKFVS